ncbi:MAG: hypothetical protein J6B15_00820 [Muribaculaceae bacterium]|nr:hypothetical protein [Muribaculaceae bacterium]
MKLNKSIILALLVACSAIGVSAQNAMSPYSKFGYGLLSDNASSAQRAMGGVGYAMKSGRQINVMNPASYAAIDSLTFLFDIGLDVTALWSEENGVPGKDFGGGLDYITMQFPINKYIGASVGLLPFSSVGYSFGTEIVHGSNAREGVGGINQLYAGVGGTPFKNLYVGANISYLFGTTINDAYAYTTSGSQSLFERVMQVRDWRVQFGVQYELPISERNSVTLGAVYTPGKSLRGKTWGTYYDISAESSADTVGYSSLKDKYSLPDSWGAGISWAWNKKLLAEVDFTYQQWKDAKSSPIINEDNGQVVFDKSTFDNRWKIAAGLQYTPKVRGGYLQRITYRVGGFFNHDYMVVGYKDPTTQRVTDNNVRDYGVSLGFGLPAPQSKTMINLGFEWRHRQASPNALIKEDYFNITLGINFNEMWFWRNKIR